MKTLAFIVCALLSLTLSAQVIYTSEVVYPSFSFLNANGHCYSNEDLSLFNDTVMNFSMLSEGREGVIYFAYSSVLGGINEVQYEQIYQGETISFDNYVFQGLIDTIKINFTIQGYGIESFCPFFLPLNPLSVNFGQVSCYQYGNYIIANCQTLSETNSQRIELHISVDCIDWNLVDSKQTKVNSSSENTYRFKSNRIESNGIYYAKFVEVDFNGSRIESKNIPFEYKAIQTHFKKYDLAGRQIE